MTTRRSLTTLFTGGSYFEGPRWHDGTWWVSDFYRQQVSRISPDGTEEVVVRVEQQPSGLDRLSDGSLVVVSMKDHRLLRFADGQLTTLADLSEHCSGRKVLGQLAVAPDGCTLDAEGHLWIADAIGARAARIAPGGSVVDEVPAPEGRVCSPARWAGRTAARCCCAALRTSWSTTGRRCARRR